ncbi:MAG: DUF2974 domain-containing protein [Lachnospiraceae bacterium]|nr:DUF2974 domain-containing protein [Lachnospiraceae bacterium]
MGNIIDYIKEYGKYSFLELPLNEVDSLVLSQMVYMNYEPFVPGMQQRNSPVSIQSIYEHPDRERILDDYWFRESNMELFSAAAQSARFGTLKMNYYVNVINLESETQFSAMTFVLEDKNVYIAFRGTDATLVGWKEDLNLAFSKPLRSQQLAVEYMERVAAYIGGDFYMGGHSKGGNLAVYAAMNCSDIARNSLLQVYNHDGPGFRPEIRQMGKYEEVAGRIHKFVPRSSVVGMILEDHEDYELIESRSIGAFQHNVYSWKIKEDRFVRVESRTASKLFRDRTLNEWILSLTEEEAHSFIDTFYDVVTASQVNSIFEFGADWKKCITGMIEAAKEVDEDTRKVIQKILKSLFEIMSERATAEITERAAEITEKAAGLAEKAAEISEKREKYKRKLVIANKKRKRKKKKNKEEQAEVTKENEEVEI